LKNDTNKKTANNSFHSNLQQFNQPKYSERIFSTSVADPDPNNLFMPDPDMTFFHPGSYIKRWMKNKTYTNINKI
jgi:hypothetical protein